MSSTNTTRADLEPSQDPELEALPKSRQPWRRLTLVVMTSTALAALVLAYALRAQVAYAWRRGPPLELGELATLALDPRYANQWVHASGSLTSTALTYQRPLDGDYFRLARVVGNAKLWVEVRVPAEYDAARFIPPSSFVGRLVPISDAGLGYTDLTERGGHSLSVPSGAWVLFDGEIPQSTRWVFGVEALLLVFLGFNVFGVLRIIRKVRDLDG